jgi:hypothetical protein
MNDRLIEFIDSPLVPKDLVALVQEYLDLVGQDVEELRSSLQEYTSTLIQRCPTLEDRKNLKMTPLHNIFNRRFHELKPAADRITNYIRAYFSVEELMKVE